MQRREPWQRLWWLGVVILAWVTVGWTPAAVVAQETKRPALIDEDEEEPVKDKKGIPAKVIARVIRGENKRIRQCSSKADVKGKLRITFKIEPDGRVSDTTIATQAFRGSRVGDCISTLIDKLKFPAHEEPEAIQVTFPFRIDPDNP